MKAKLCVFFLSLSAALYGQGLVKGKVSDDMGQPLPGVSVIQKGTTKGVVTDVDGVYSLQGISDDAILVFSFIGYQTQEILKGARENIDVVLAPDVKTLAEVVVLGYGTQKKSVATAALSQVDAKNLTGFSTARVDQMLQGQVSGVMIKSSSGQPGSGLNLVIRGVGSNGNNNPLIIVDGVVANDGILQSLNPADIASVTILKDAASAAIYGARGANGIVQVTTKKAKDGETSFTYSGNYGVQQPWRIPTMLNSSQYVDLITEKYQNGGSALPVDFPTQNSITANTNWMDKIFQVGSTQSHVLSIANGTKKGSLNASLSYFDQKGVVAPEKSYLKRITGRIGTEQKINDFLTFGENLFLVHSSNGRIPENSEFGSPIADALVYDPTTPVYNPGQQYGFAQSPFVQKEYVNPLSRIFISNVVNNTDEVTGNAYFKVNPIKDLTFRTDAGFDYAYYTGKGFTPSYNFTPAFFNTINDIYQYEAKQYRWQWENYATYTKSLDKHHVTVTAGTTIQYRNNGTGFSASSSGIPEDVQLDKNFWYITNTPDSLQRSGSFGSEKQTLQSVFGRLNYDYDEKYLISLTLRRDGSSQFGPNNRFGNFPSASVGWVASREAFWPQTFVNFAKLRASYGVNGNDRINSLAYAAIIERTGTYPFGKPGSQTIYNGQSSSFSPNPNVKWEQSKQVDVGVELGFWNDALTLEFDYYNKITSGLLMNATVPDYGGTGAPVANVGEITNHGLELELKYNKRIGDVGIQLGFTATTLKNKVTKVNADGYQDGYTWPVRNAVITRMELNKPIGFFRGYKTDGIFHDQGEIYAHINSDGDLLQPKAKPGDIKYVDTNGDGVIDAKDIVQIGKPWADVILGFTAGAQYKGFDFRVLFAASIGNDAYRSYERQDVPNNNYTSAWLDHWSESNPDGKYPRVTTNDTNNNTRPSDFYVEDASYLRMRNIQLGYTIPPSIVKKAKLSSLRIYVSADNLLTVTSYSGFDPEAGTSGWILDTGIDKGFYPLMKAVSGGLTLSF